MEIKHCIYGFSFAFHRTDAGSKLLTLSHYPVYHGHIMAKKKNEITIENLARMTQNEFTVVRNELHEGFRTLGTALHQLTKAVETGFQHVNARLDTLHEDISDLPEIRQSLRDLEMRVARLERRSATAQ